MIEILTSLYPWIKSLHVISVISWMAGIFYLPRLFVHHTEKAKDENTDLLFQMMELKLFRTIMNPAMISTWIFGLLLVSTPGIVDWAQYWPWVKAGMVLAMTWFHHWLGSRRKELAAGTCTITGRQFRLMNEVPTILMIVIVVMVIARPF
ncbi:MAG: putative membrane protein [Paracoccaceae bacterium]|jgi:putative membrane protein